LIDCPLKNREKQIFIEFDVPWRELTELAGDIDFDSVESGIIEKGKRRFGKIHSVTTNIATNK